MQRCPSCSRHIRVSESRCPFCGAAQNTVTGTAHFARSTLIGLALFACSGDDVGGGGMTSATTSTSSGKDSMSSTGTSTSTSESTASSGSTSSGSTSSETETSESSSETRGTTSDDSDTSTSDDSDGTTTDSDGTDSDGTDSDGTTTDDPDTSTTQPTTGGDCMGEGEEICGGVCVNTQKDSEHCGECFHECEEIEACFEGDCAVILPYGAPMPEPLWA